MKKAFTLAEVLITLGIIGVVAAITIPNLITTHKKKVTVTKLQKAISELNQAYRLSFDENGEPEDVIDPEEYYKKYWAPYLKASTVCKKDKNCGYKDKYFKYKGGKYSSIITNTTYAKVLFFTNEFAYIILTCKNAQHNKLVEDFDIFVDINGVTGPNTFGKDVFWLIRDPGRGVSPYMYDKTTPIIVDNCKRKAEACAEWIRRSGWQIPKNYPW